MNQRWLAGVVLTLSLGGCGSCGGSGDHGGDSAPAAPQAPRPSDPPPGETVSGNPTIPRGSVPPYGVTWHIGITENVPLSTMQALYATFVSVSDTIWNISEGQVRVHRIRLWDNAAPGLTAQGLIDDINGAAASTANLDILAFPDEAWNVEAGGAVVMDGGLGRNDRLMIIPATVDTFVGTHEGSHFVFHLTWSPGTFLVDEYLDGIQDAACVMESQNMPLRWCSSGNHAAQGSQPTSCWQQIQTDYPAFAHAGTDTAGSTAPAPEVEYNDVP